MPETCTDTFRKRFFKSWEDYVTSVAHQAEDRSQSHILDLESFIQIRRLSSGGFPTMLIHEMDMDIPDDIRWHPTIVEMEKLGVDLIGIVNVSEKANEFTT